MNYVTEKKGVGDSPLSLSKNSRQTSIIFETIVYLIFILVYPYIFIRYGLDYTDSAYHYMCYNGSNVAGSMTYMYAILGNLLMHITGDSFLSFRFWGLFITILTVIIPAIFIREIRVLFRVRLRYAAIVSILLTALSFNSLEWDTFSGIILSVIFTVAYNYIYNRNNFAMLSLAVLTALLGSVRLPSLLVVVPLITLLLYCTEYFDAKKLKSALSHSIIYLVTTILVYCTLWVLFRNYGVNNVQGLDNPALSSEAARLPLSFSGIFKHVIGIGMRYIKEGMKILEMIGLIWALGLTWQKANHLTRYKYISRIAILSILVLYMTLTVSFKYSNWNLSLFFSAMFLFAATYLAYYNLKAEDYRSGAGLVFAMLFGFASFIGSDTGLLKLAPLYLIMLPVVLYGLFNRFNRPDRLTINCLLLIALIFAMINKAYNETYQDQRIYKLKAEIDHPKLKGILTTVERKQQIERILKDIDTLYVGNHSQRDVLYYGSESHLLRYLTNNKSKYALPFGMFFNDNDQAKRMIEYISASDLRPYVVLIFGYPEAQVPTDGGLISRVLYDFGYTANKTGKNYMIMYPPKE